jgi:hypothetical protein
MAYVLLGAAVVLTGAMAAVVLPPPLVGVALLLVLLRVCWLDENIKADLIGAEKVPADYRRAAAEAPRLSPEPLPEDPALVATAMRGQIQAWSAAALGTLSVLVLTESGWPLGFALLGGMALVALGYWQADRLVTTILHLDRGEPLPPRALARAWGPAHSWRVGDDD